VAEEAEGIRIELFPDGREIRAVRIYGRSQGVASRMLAGQALEQIPERAGQLFSVCRTGQRQAALAACEGALGKTPAVGQRALRSLLTEAEAARDWAMRIFLDGPRQLGIAPPDPEAVKSMVGPLNRLGQELDPDGDRQCLGGDALGGGAAERVAAVADALDAALVPLFATTRGGDLAQIEAPEQFSRWARSGVPAGAAPALFLKRGWGGQGGHERGLMAGLPASDIAEELDGERGDAFCARPHWESRQPEVGPLARFDDHPALAALTRAQGPGLMARWVARLIALRTVPARLHALAGLLEDDTPDPPETPGLGRAEVGRGPLWHWAAPSESGHAVRYRILAPTEWNFHPDGPVPHALMGLDPFKRAEGLERAEAVVAAFDPCVTFSLDWVSKD
jgi:hypothetical protein